MTTQRRTSAFRVPVVGGAPLVRGATSLELRARSRALVRKSARAGITIVEVLIAMTVLTVGVGGLLSNAAAIATQMGGGARQTVAASIAQSRMDSLTSLSCATLNLSGVVSGTSLNRSVKEVWTVTSGKNIKTITVTITIPRRTNPLVYKTVIPCRG